ncbi:MAG: histidine kinase [Spirochaetes bacterium]|nr:histidine kinase [Spirochaetota bacterium]
MLYLSGVFSWKLLSVPLINSFFICIGLIPIIISLSNLITKISSSFIIIFTSFVGLGVNFAGFLVNFISDPLFFFVETFSILLYFLVNLLFIIVIYIMSGGFLVYNQMIIENEKKLADEIVLRKEIEHKMHLSQITPHFLFNALNVITSLLDTPKKAEKAMLDLAALLRFNLELSDNDQIPIKSELDFIEKYLTIQKLRFDQRLDYQISCSINPLIPPMILQPIVENSIKHNLQKTDYLFIDINVIEENNLCTIQVKDSEAILQPSMVGNGIGLKNTKKRIELAGGTFIIEDGGIKITL